MPDLIITGVPRSGTTLAAAMVDQADDAFCLSEPDRHVELMRAATDAEDFVVRLQGEFDATRKALLAGGTVSDKRAADGSPVTDYFADGEKGYRKAVFTIRDVSRAGLSPDFVLGVKHNALYAAVLPQIARSGRFRVIALVRDPVAVLASWQSLRLPVSEGRLPAADRFWPEMESLTHSGVALLEKQIRIYDLLCRRFTGLAGMIDVFRYEEVVANPTTLLAVAGLTASRSQANVVVRAEPVVRRESKEGIALFEHVRLLAAGDQLAGLCHYYPEYR